VFSADGCRLVLATPTGHIERHPLDIGKLYAAAAARQLHTSTVSSTAPTNGPSREAVN
jgi:hypothetical protein